ncbi:MAG: anti-sigma factor antagonist [Clostridia bacterium]|nr:anti-sigma factor antagonist [Clostridia bacterium]
MQVEILREEGQITARLMGELDHHTAAPVRQQIDAAALSCRCTRLILDLSRLTFMDSSGVGLIMGRYRMITAVGGTLRVENPSPRVMQMLQLAGLNRLPIWNERKDVCETHQ